MKFEVTTMFPAHTTVVFDYWYTLVLNDVIAFTATKEDDVICQIMGMQSKVIKQEMKLSSMNYPLEGFKSMGVNV